VPPPNKARPRDGVRRLPPRVAGGVLAVVVLIVDQATKWWILNDVMQPPRVIDITPFFNLVLGWNRGVSFGLFGAGEAGTAWLLIAVALVISTVLFVWLLRTDRIIVGLGLGAIIGGALGNVTDRLRFGAVTDFLDFHLLGVHWPAFNVADAGITVGAAVLILHSLFQGAEHRTSNTVEREGNE
jgi:signal peptidase II